MDDSYIINFSIHALLAESDLSRNSAKLLTTYFLSTLSLRRATKILPACCIHLLFFYPRSPCGERPVCFLLGISFALFYPRSPCGERLNVGTNSAGLNVFSIHALLAESDGAQQTTVTSQSFSIHALLAESDSSKIISSSVTAFFYPRSPCGERQQKCTKQ